MHESEDIKASIEGIEKHIESQDLEMYRQQRMIDSLLKQVKKLEERIASLEQGGGAGGMPADERPPHY